MQKYKAPTFDEYNKVIANLDKTKTSNPMMTKYEFDLIIGIRTNQLSLGAIPFVDVSGLQTKSNMELRKIALREFAEGRLPYIVKRTLPPGNVFEYFRVRDMDLTDVESMLKAEPFAS